MGTGCHTGKPPTPAARVVGKGVQHGGHHTPLQVQPSQEVVIVNGRTMRAMECLPHANATQPLARLSHTGLSVTERARASLTKCRPMSAAMGQMSVSLMRPL
jgi:hypothetical protein